jgi:hypothetical protein
MVKNRSPISVTNLGYFCPMQVFYISPQSAVSKLGLLWVFLRVQKWFFVDVLDFQIET